MAPTKHITSQPALRGKTYKSYEILGTPLEQMSKRNLMRACAAMIDTVNQLTRDVDDAEAEIKSLDEEVDQLRQDVQYDEEDNE